MILTRGSSSSYLPHRPTEGRMFDDQINVVCAVVIRVEGPSVHVFGKDLVLMNIVRKMHALG